MDSGAPDTVKDHMKGGYPSQEELAAIKIQSMQRGRIARIEAKKRKLICQVSTLLIKIFHL